MIYVTGDMHGLVTRFKQKAVKKLKKTDTLIICGDFGFLWDGSIKEKKLLKWIGKRRFTTLFVDGTHDNHHLLAQYPEEAFCGGMARPLSGRLWQLLRGYVYTLEGESFLAMGGGTSTDSDVRTLGETWWQEEVPSEEEILRGQLNLQERDFAVDYIISHQCPPSLMASVGAKSDNYSPLDAFFDKVQKLCKYKAWFFGAYHMDKRIPPTYRAVYTDVVPVAPKPKKRSLFK